MKKLFRLFFILGITSLASASFSLSVVDSRVQSSGIMEGNIYLILAADSTIILSNFDIGDVPDPEFSGYAGSWPPSPDFGILSNQDYIDALRQHGETYVYVSLNVAVYPFTGDFVSADYSGLGAICLYTWDENTGDLNLADSVYVPDPATMILLGLGALVLRCKK